MIDKHKIRIAAARLQGWKNIQVYSFGGLFGIPPNAEKANIGIYYDRIPEKILSTLIPGER